MAGQSEGGAFLSFFFPFLIYSAKCGFSKKKAQTPPPIVRDLHPLKTPPLLPHLHWQSALGKILLRFGFQQHSLLFFELSQKVHNLSRIIAFNLANFVFFESMAAKPFFLPP